MGETILHVGALGHGQTVKVISNAVGATNARRSRRRWSSARRRASTSSARRACSAPSSAASTMVALKAEPMLEHDYTPLFRLEHMLKDVGICLDESEAAGAPFPAAALARELYTAAMGRGLARRGLRRGARGGRGARRHPDLTRASASAACMPAEMP